MMNMLGFSTHNNKNQLSKRSSIPKFEIRQYATKLNVNENINENKNYSQFYVSMYPDNTWPIQDF